MGRHRSGPARIGTTIYGFALPFARMNSPVARTLLSVAGFGIFALAVDFLARAELRWELWAAGLLGLLAYHIGYPSMSWPRLQGRTGDDAGANFVPGQDAFATPREPRRETPGGSREPARSAPRPLPDGLPASYGLAILDREYRIVWCNDAAAAQFGIDAQHDIGRRIAAVFRHPSLAPYLAAGDFSKSLRMQAGDRDAPILSVQFVPYVASGWLLLSRNVARAARLEIMRRECIANVSHELRGPLTVLVGFLETVREFKLDTRMSLDYLDRMEEQCKRMQRIIEDLLRLSTLESAPEPSRNERVGIGAILDRVRTDAEALSAGRHRIVLDAKGSFDLLGAEGEIASALGNLASNAVRYSLPGGVVRLVWRASHAGAEFAVEDTGIGIEKEHIPRLTERFYRVDRDRSRHSGGTGLGLAIVKHALLRHQATLEIESEPGRGSRFTARFPAHRVVDVKAPLANPPAA
jgi:two-component system phosphate regulon sensor histidine kinase PhoR